MGWSRSGWKGHAFRSALPIGLVALFLTSLSGTSHSSRFPDPESPVAAPEPSLELSSTRLDLGDGKPNERLPGSLEIRNVGEKELVFDISASCACGNLAPRSGTVPPGGAQVVRFVVQLPDQANTERSLQLTVKSNDPRRPQAACSVVAKCPAPFRVTPAFVEFGKVGREARAVRPVELRVAVANAGHGPVRARLSGGNFRIVAQSADSIQVAPAQGLDFGEHFGSLELFLEGREEHVVRIPLRVQVPQPLSAVPSTLALNKADRGYDPAYFVMVGESSSGPLGEVAVVNAPEWCRVEALEQIGSPHRRRYRLVVKEGCQAPQRSSLELKDLLSGHQCKLQVLGALGR